MNKIADGIKVYFNSKHDPYNNVIFSNNYQKTYDVGGMLFEVISDDSMYLLYDKVKNMIVAFPDKRNPINTESVTACFKWLYNTVQDDELPVTTELFRSTFNDAIQRTIADELQTGENDTIEDFFNAAFTLYFDNLAALVVYSEAIAAEASRIENSSQHKLCNLFLKIAEEYNGEYTQRCKTQITSNFKIQDTIPITNFFQLLVFEYCRMKATRKAIKICRCCERLFIPEGRIDTLYCSQPAPNYLNKTCKDVGAQLRRKQKRDDDAVLKEYYNGICNYYNIIRRAKLNNPTAVQYYQGKLDALKDEHKKRTQIKIDNKKG